MICCNFLPWQWETLDRRYRNRQVQGVQRRWPTSL
jgi:hypothetical protein